MIMPRQSHTCAMRGKDVFVFGGGMLRDAYDTLEFWNGIQWEIRMIPFKTAGSTLFSAGRTMTVTFAVSSSGSSLLFTTFSITSSVAV